MTALLQIQNLSVDFHTDDAVVHAVDGVDLEVHEGEIVGVTGHARTLADNPPPPTPPHRPPTPAILELWLPFCTVTPLL